MKALIIDAIREKYSASEVKTMTIAELIEELQYYDDDTKVILSFDNGYTFGGIRRLSMEDAEIEE